MFISIHLIQSLPPSNPNRGEDGAPKSCFYGGSRRSRISSQAQKRAARLYYQSNSGIDRAQLAFRSRRWGQELAAKLTEFEHPTIVSNLLLNLFNVKAEKLIQESAAGVNNLLFLANHEIGLLAAIANEHADLLNDLAERCILYQQMVEEAEKQGKTEKKAKDAFDGAASKKELAPLHKAIVGRFSRSIPGDVALFGRMMSNLVETSVDGSVQVAHAVSVNQLRGRADGLVQVKSNGKTSWVAGDDVDFFTACDDIKSATDIDSGAAHMGEVPYSSPVHYRYANVCVSELAELMGDDGAARASVQAFINAFVMALPDGYSRSFAHQTVPAFTLIEVSPRQPYSYIEAFQSSIDSDMSGQSIVAQAVTRLMDHRSECVSIYGGKPISATVAALGSVYPGGENLDSAVSQAIDAAFGSLD